MSTEVQQRRQQKLREAAILVASLEDDLAERLVASMPKADAAAVRRALTQLGAVDPDERDDIVAKFRQKTEVQRPTQVDGVELDASLLARFEEIGSHGGNTKTFAAGAPLESLSEEEAATVVGMLSAEHPQTISIVLSRLNHSGAANLLSKFPPTIQADVLTRMANCDSVDEQSAQVIESQLGEWIDQHRQQRQRMAAGLDLVQRILSNTPESQRVTILTQLKGRNPDLAGRLTEKQNPLPDPPLDTSPAFHRKETQDDRAKVSGNLQQEIEPKQFVRATPPLAQKIAPSSVEIASTDSSEKLDQLDDATLIATLSQTDRQVVTLALAGASEALMKRVVRGLPRRQAVKLRTQLRNIGPTRLSDILAAQRQLLHNARQLTTNG